MFTVVTAVCQTTIFPRPDHNCARTHCSLRYRRQTTTVKLSQPFVCQLFLVGCILLSITTAFYVGEASQVACLLRPWMLHVALTFTSRWRFEQLLISMPSSVLRATGEHVAGGLSELAVCVEV